MTTGKSRDRARYAPESAAAIQHDSGFHKGDARKLIRDPKRGLEDGTVKLLLTDPPYGMDHASGIAGDMTRKQAARLLRGVLRKLEPKLREDAMCAVFCEWDDATLQKVVEEFFDVRGRVRWGKSSGPGGHFFIYDCEDIIIGTRKGVRLPKTFLLPLPGVICVPRTTGGIHPMEKPDRLLWLIISAITAPGDLVADPFAGSGSALLAALQLACKYWGAELNKDKDGNKQDWYPRGAERLKRWAAGLHDGIDPGDYREIILDTLRDIHRLGEHDFRNAHWGATRSMIAEPEAGPGVSDADLQAARAWRNRFPDRPSITDLIHNHPRYLTDDDDVDDPEDIVREGPNKVKIILGDFRQVMTKIPADSIDLIFSDPPWDAESVPLYGLLAEQAARVLKPGGHLVVYAGPKWLQEIRQTMEPHLGDLRYRWQLMVRHVGGPSALIGRLGVRAGYKPLLWFTKGANTGAVLNDVIDSRLNKFRHPWAQSGDAARYVIDKLVPPDGFVLDPMCGSGTTLVAAAHLLRSAIGIDVDAKAIKIARKRLGLPRVS